MMNNKYKQMSLLIFSALLLFIIPVSCKKDSDKEVTITGKWILVSTSYKDSTTPVEVVNFPDDSNFLNLAGNNTYNVTLGGETGAGTYSYNAATRTISFKISTGDDDLTDEDGYTVKVLSASALTLENIDGNSSYEITFKK